MGRHGGQRARLRVLETGDILVGRYEVESLIGRGGMSSVFAGIDRTLGLLATLSCALARARAVPLAA